MDKNLGFQFPRANAYDEKIKKYRCEAELVVADTWKLPFKYESQLNDENRHIVTVTELICILLCAVLKHRD